MKKLLLIFALIVGCYSLSYGQTPTDIFKMFSKEKNVVALNVNGSFGSMVNIDEELMKEVESVMLLVFNDCEEAIKDKFNKEVKNLEVSGYETLASVSRNGKKLKILMKGNDDVVSELLVLVSGAKPMMAVVKGALSKSELIAKADGLTLNM